jgi:nucleotide-binding universal stress UspA family protein
VAAHGDPAVLISDHAAEEDIDLAVAGTHGRTGLMNVLLGSVAVAILDETPCDVMIVPSKGSENARLGALTGG